MTISKRLSSYLEEMRIIQDSIDKNDGFKVSLATDDLYDETKLTEGKGLLTNAVGLFNRHLARVDEVMAKSQEVKNLFKEITGDFIALRRRLRAVFYYDRASRSAFGLDTAFDGTISKTIPLVTNFFNSALTTPELLTKAQTAGILDTRFQTGLARIQEYQTARAEYVSLRGTRQELVEARDKAFRELRLWMNGLIQACRQICKDNPQMLESLGIFARNRPLKKKKGGATTDPGTDPGTTDPGTTDPGTTDPGTTDPTETPTEPAAETDGN